MKPTLKNGKITPPATIAEGHTRLIQLAQEITRIRTQIADPSRPARSASMAIYDAWRATAGRALAAFETEMRQINAWINDAENTLLRDAYHLLLKLEEDEVEFDADEIVILNRLDEHFKTIGAPRPTREDATKTFWR